MLPPTQSVPDAWQLTPLANRLASAVSSGQLECSGELGFAADRHECGRRSGPRWPAEAGGRRSRVRSLNPRVKVGRAG